MVHFHIEQSCHELKLLHKNLNFVGAIHSTGRKVCGLKGNNNV